jgi:hypothetical protein
MALHAITIKEWTDALRSGEYKQGQGFLKHRLPEGGDLYCCLGVALKLCGRKRFPKEVETQFFSEYGSLKLLHPTITAQDEKALAQKNDDGFSFAEIADYIDERFGEAPAVAI